MKSIIKDYKENLAMAVVWILIALNLISVFIHPAFTGALCGLWAVFHSLVLWVDGVE